MKNTKLMLLGIVVVLFGICAILLSGLRVTLIFPTEIYELLGVVCPIVGVVLSVIGFFNEKQ